MKRIFSFSLIALLLAGSLGLQAKGPKKQMALQLYSIRSVFNDGNYQQKHAEVFKQLRDMGFTGVEAASYNNGKFYGVSPEQYRQDCIAAGLEPISSHATRGLNRQELDNHDFTAAFQWWDQAIAAHKAAGMTYLVTPSGPVPKNLKEAQTLCDYYNAIGERCRQAGLSYGYHTHSHEYQKVEGTPWIEIMLKNVKPENMFWQMDVYWCVMAQQSPVVWFKKFPGRCRMLHIKDLYELGQSGMLGFDAITPASAGWRTTSLSSRAPTAPSPSWKACAAPPSTSTTPNSSRNPTRRNNVTSFLLTTPEAAPQQPVEAPLHMFLPTDTPPPRRFQKNLYISQTRVPFRQSQVGLRRAEAGREKF